MMIYPKHETFSIGSIQCCYDLCICNKLNSELEKKSLYDKIRRWKIYKRVNYNRLGVFEKLYDGPSFAHIDEIFTDNECDNRNVLKRYSIEGRNHRRFYQEPLSIGLKIKLGSDNW